MQEPENESGFVVRDRRHSSFEEKSEKSEPKQSPGISSPPTDEPKSDSSPEPEAAFQSSAGPVNFMSFILGMAQTALFQMGLIQFQGSEKPTKDMNGARQTIDIIAMIEEKTRGNLTDDEKKVINDTLFQLRMAFVEVSKQ